MTPWKGPASAGPFTAPKGIVGLPPLMPLAHREPAAREAAAPVPVVQHPPQRRRDRPGSGPDLQEAPILIVPHHHPARDASADLLRDADVALYRAKARGGGHYEVFDPTMNARALERLELEGDLRHALERAELVLHYQPKVALDSGGAANPSRSAQFSKFLKIQ